MDFHHINMAGLLQMASHQINVLGGDDILEGILKYVISVGIDNICISYVNL